MKPSEGRALICLFVIALVIQGMDTYYWSLFPPEINYDSAQVEAIKKQWHLDSVRRDSIQRSALRVFDPNKVDTMFLKRLGLKTRARTNWQAYLKAGGYFKSEKDLAKIYGVDSFWLAKIKAYLIFPQEERLDFRAVESKEYQLRAFDPNKASMEDLLNMGLSFRQAKGVEVYRRKYREFSQAKDIFKVYAIDSALAVKLYPYIHIDLDSAFADDLIPIDLNSADSSSLCRVPGIGPYQAQKIIRWRQRLGGFHSASQLIEFGILDSLALVEITPHVHWGLNELKRININYTGLEELRAHPYISYSLARNIIDFRERVRLFKKVEELMNIELVDAVLFSKLAPYFVVSETDSLR